MHGKNIKCGKGLWGKMEKRLVGSVASGKCQPTKIAECNRSGKIDVQSRSFAHKVNFGEKVECNHWDISGIGGNNLHEMHTSCYV